MTQSFPSDFKSCAVCNFWEGARKLSALRDKVIVDSFSIKGKCLLRGAPWEGWEMRSVLSCSKWVKWAALKETVSPLS